MFHHRIVRIHSYLGIKVRSSKIHGGHFARLLGKGVCIAPDGFIQFIVFVWESVMDACILLQFLLLCRLRLLFSRLLRVFGCGLVERILSISLRLLLYPSLLIIIAFEVDVAIILLRLLGYAGYLPGSAFL